MKTIQTIYHLDQLTLVSGYVGESVKQICNENEMNLFSWGAARMKPTTTCPTFWTKN